MGNNKQRKCTCSSSELNQEAQIIDCINELSSITTHAKGLKATTYFYQWLICERCCIKH